MKFSIRDLLWLTLLVAIGAAWWVDHARLHGMLTQSLTPVPARGHVTLRGQPLPLAYLTVIYPDGNSAAGVTDKKGEFTLFFFGQIGAPPGRQLVLLIREAGPPKNLVAAKYSRLASSPLRVDIPPGGTTALTIDLP